jgi:hypothetical protein
MELIAAVGSNVECRAIALSDLDGLRGEWVVLTKSALLASNRDTLCRLRELGHRLIADFIDHPVEDGMASSVDVLLASSVCQEQFFRSRFSQIPTLHVTHHVDLRMPKISPLMDRARFGYFGRIANCRYADEIADLVCIVDANDAADMTWMTRLRHTNAHYALRGEEDPSVFKPFVKGFTAAHCAAPIIVASTDEEAIHYLGTKYPFTIDDLSLGSVREHVGRFAGEYGTSTWNSAVEAMRAVAARSTQDHVKHELRALLNAIW